MSSEIGPLPPIQPSPASRRAAEPAAAGFSLDLAPTRAADTVELSLPPYPPREVLAEVDAAAGRADELAAANRELNFRVDDETGRVIIEVRDFEGNVLRTIPPSRVLEVMAGASL